MNETFTNKDNYYNFLRNIDKAEIAIHKSKMYINSEYQPILYAEIDKIHDMISNLLNEANKLNEQSK